MTYNIRHGPGNARPEKPVGEVDLCRIAGVIEQQRPDIVAVQEVDRFWRRSDGEDQPARLADLLGMSVCYAATVVLCPEWHETRRRQYGVAMLSRFPIVVQRGVPLPATQGWEPRGMLLARFGVAGRSVTVITTPLQVDQPGEAEDGRRQRSSQAREVARAVQAAGEPAIVMGISTPPRAIRSWRCCSVQPAVCVTSGTSAEMIPAGRFPPAPAATPPIASTTSSRAGSSPSTPPGWRSIR